MKAWMMRILGSMNIVMAIGGIIYFIVILGQSSGWSNASSARNWLLFFLFVLVNGTLLGLLSYSGMRLLKGEIGVLRLAGVILILEPLSWWLNVVIFWNMLSPADIVFGSPNFLFTPQVLTGYPIFGLVVIALLGRSDSTREGQGRLTTNGA